MEEVKKTQHFTSNFKIILYNIDFHPEEAIDPFAGECDLVNYSPNTRWELYDIDIKKPGVIQRDTLLNPLNYKGKSVITNPPYLARNKSEDKRIFDKYQVDDLYKASILSIIGCENGILIIPVNFFTDEYSSRVRKEFLSNYKVDYVNVFTKQVFENTTYNICSFYFEKGKTKEVTFYDYFNKSESRITLYPQYSYRVGGEFYSKYSGEQVYFGRLLLKDDKKSFPYVTGIQLDALDTRNTKLGLRYDSSILFYGKSTDRIRATLTCSLNLNEDNQKELIELFNNIIKEARETFGNLLFTTFRDNGRKRIGFDLVYQILSKISMDKGYISNILSYK